MVVVVVEVVVGRGRGGGRELEGVMGYVNV